MLKIDMIHFSSGKVWRPAAINVFVGPNNSGKSQSLKDVFRGITRGNSDGVSISNISFSYTIDENLVLAKLFPNVKDDDNGNAILDFAKSDFSGGQPVRINRLGYDNALLDKN